MQKTSRKSLLAPGILTISGITVFIGSVLPYYTWDIGINLGVGMDSHIYVSEDAIDQFHFIPVIFALLVLCLALACLRGWSRVWPHYLVSLLSFTGTIYLVWYLIDLYEDAQAANGWGANDAVGPGIFLIAAGLFFAFLGSIIFIIRSWRTSQDRVTESDSEKGVDYSNSTSYAPSPDLDEE